MTTSRDLIDERASRVAEDIAREEDQRMWMAMAVYRDIRQAARDTVGRFLAVDRPFADPVLPESLPPTEIFEQRLQNLDDACRRYLAQRGSWSNVFGAATEVWIYDIARAAEPNLLGGGAYQDAALAWLALPTRERTPNSPTLSAAIYAIRHTA